MTESHTEPHIYEVAICGKCSAALLYKWSEPDMPFCPNGPGHSYTSANESDHVENEDGPIQTIEVVPKADYDELIDFIAELQSNDD